MAKASRGHFIKQANSGLVIAPFLKDYFDKGGGVGARHEGDPLHHRRVLVATVEVEDAELRVLEFG